MKSLLSASKLSLLLLLSCNVTHEHLWMKCFNHVLVIVEHLVCFVELALSELLLIGFFLCVNSSSLDLIIFKFLDSFIFFLLSLSMDGIWPLWNPVVGEALELGSLAFSHGVIVLIFARLGAHSLNSLEFIVAQDGSVFGCKSLGFSLCVALSSFGGLLHSCWAGAWSHWSWVLATY